MYTVHNTVNDDIQHETIQKPLQTRSHGGQSGRTPLQRRKIRFLSTVFLDKSGDKSGQDNTIYGRGGRGILDQVSSYRALLPAGLTEDKAIASQ